MDQQREGKSLPEVKICVTDTDSVVSCSEPDNQSDASITFSLPEYDNERKTSAFQSDLSEISEDGVLEMPEEENRTRKVSIHPGEVTHHHYIPHHYKHLHEPHGHGRKLSAADILHNRKLSAGVLQQVRKLSEANINVAGKRISVADALLHPHSKFGPPSRKCSMDAFYSLQRPSIISDYSTRMSVASIFGGGAESICDDSVEALPDIEHYRDLINAIAEIQSQRPTMDELRDDERVIQIFLRYPWYIQ